jgi:plastocyanin
VTSSSTSTATTSANATLSSTSTSTAAPGSPVTTTSASTTSATSAVPGPARLQVIAKEFSYTLSRSSVPAGPVVIEFVNAGQDPHNLNAVPAGGGDTVAAFGLTSPGSHPDVQFTFAPGTYTLFCSLPNHAAMGMAAPLTVTGSGS